MPNNNNNNALVCHFNLTITEMHPENILVMRNIKKYRTAITYMLYNVENLPKFSHSVFAKNKLL
jgi:hypothetical protein